jgi:hypothetical protein
MFCHDLPTSCKHENFYSSGDYSLRETISYPSITHGSRSPESKNKRRLEIHRMIYTKNFLIPIPRFDQPVKPQTIFVLVDAADEPPRKILVRSLIDRAFEYGLLHSLAEVLTDLRHSAQAPFPFRRLS